MRIHLDHNATTPLRPEARDRWLKVADSLAGNPSSLHTAGRSARAIVDDARCEVAGALGVHEDEITFTSGGTESNNLVLEGVCRTSAAPSTLITTALEHSSVLEPARSLSLAGHRVHVLPATRSGHPDLDPLAEHLAGDRPGACLVSVMWANNETGCVSDLRAVGEVLAALPGPKPLFHTDAVQALGRLPLGLADWGTDLASFSAHKVGGPVGVGVLWRRSGTRLRPLMLGGEQEAGLRPGTENVAGIAAAATAIGLAVQERAGYAQRVGERLLTLWDALSDARPPLELVGPKLDRTTLGLDDATRAPFVPRLPNTLCLRVPDSDGKVLATRLDLAGIEVSTGSACASGSIEPSHVLLAMGYTEDEARAGLRLSLGRTTSHEECMQVAGLLKQLFTSSHAT